jgi:hypothetical protein
MTLHEIMEMRNALEHMERTLKAIREENGIDSMEEQIKMMKFTLQSELKEAVDSGISQEGSLRIINRGRMNRMLSFDEVSSEPWYKDVVKIEVGKVEGKLKEAGLSKEQIKEYMDAKCLVVQSESYDIVDLLEE